MAVGAVGVVIAFLAIAADAIGLSGSGSEGFGNRQVAGLLVGLALVVVGVVVVLRDRRSS